MDSPFIFIKEVVGDLFVGRKEELTWLASNMQNAQNTVIIASPRSGKTSLIRQAAIQVQKQDLSLKFCYVNMYNVRDPYEFYSKLANSIMLTIADTTDDWQKLIDKYLPNCAPKIIVDNKQNEIYLHFADNTFLDHKPEIIKIAKVVRNKHNKAAYDDDLWDDDDQDGENNNSPLVTPDSISTLTEFVLNDAKTKRSEVLNFAQQYAHDKNIKMVMCIEEIQNIENFDSPLDFQKELARAIRPHSSVSYVVTGGKKNALRELFEKPKTPFFKFGEIFHLQEIDEKLFSEFITRSFSKSGRVIQKELAEKLSRTVKNHPHYVQLFAHLIWHNTKGFATEALIESTVDDLLDYCHYGFNRIIEGLSNSQVNYLKAVIDGVDRFCSAENIFLYKLNSSANITRVRGALEKKEILEFIRNKPLFIDPVFELWFRQRYMKSRMPITVN